MEKRQQLQEGEVGKDAGGAGGGGEEGEQFGTPWGNVTWHSRKVWSPGRVWPWCWCGAAAFSILRALAASWPCCLHLYLLVQDSLPRRHAPILLGLPAAEFGGASCELHQGRQGEWRGATSSCVDLAAF